MMNTDLPKLSDRELLDRLQRAVRDERFATAQLIALLMELDARKLYLGEGCSSLFTYCTQVLHLSEHAAYNRIEAARAARRFPIILGLIDSGAVTLTTVRLLAPHLTDANHADMLQRATHMSKRQVELLVASVAPLPDAPSVVRKLPAPTPRQVQHTDVASQPSVPARPIETTGENPMCAVQQKPAEVKPLAPERYKIQVTVSRAAYDKLRRAQDLLRHSVPNGDPSVIIERALDVLVTELERAKTAATTRPRSPKRTASGSRQIAAAVRRSVWERDGGRCAFKGSQGRCAETGFLEYHHVVPFADGGDTSTTNIELRCRAHNQYEAALWCGAARTPEAREDRASFGARPSSFRNELGVN